MSRLHAVLAPSAAARWLVCSKSARLEEMTTETKSNIYADEGTLAHAIGDILIRHKLGLIKTNEYIKYMRALAESVDWEKYYNEEMRDYCEDYANYVVEQYNVIKAHDKSAKIVLEQRIELSEYVPESWGHIDAGILSNYKVVVIDLKYGKGTPVDVANNKQMMLYALALVSAWQDFYAFREIEMHVYQPRINNIADFSINFDELMFWAEEELKPKALLAFNGGNNFVPGTHCKFCTFRNRCKAYSDYNLELAKYEFKEPTELKDSDIADILERLPVFKNWASMIEEYALMQSVRHGKRWPGLKLVEGRSNRQFIDEKKVESVLLKTELKPEQIYQPRKIFGIGALEKLLGKDRFSRILGKFIVKPPGSPTLVSIDDRRPEISSLDRAKEDFTTRELFQEE